MGPPWTPDRPNVSSHIPFPSLQVRLRIKVWGMREGHPSSGIPEVQAGSFQGCPGGGGEWGRVGGQPILNSEPILLLETPLPASLCPAALSHPYLTSRMPPSLVLGVLQHPPWLESPLLPPELGVLVSPELEAEKAWGSGNSVKEGGQFLSPAPSKQHGSPPGGRRFPNTGPAVMASIPPAPTGASLPSPPHLEPRAQPLPTAVRGPPPLCHHSWSPP